MTEAETAYRAAVAEIERVRKAGEKQLDLSRERFRELDRIPPEVATVPSLVAVNFSQTNITDISRLLELPKLDVIWLNHTKVVDLSPIAALPALITLRLNFSAVTDLRPIPSLRHLAKSGFYGLEYEGCAATRADAELARLSEIEDEETRTRETLAYLNTLPPWPEPYLPKSRPDGKPPEPIGATGPAPTLSPSPVPGRGLVPPAGLRRLTLKDARMILEQGHPILRDRCQRVVGDLDDALALLEIRIPNDPDQLAAHDLLSRTLTLSKAALMGIHDAIPEDLSDRPIDDVAARRLRAAFDAALESLKNAAQYIDRKDHTPTYGGLLRLGAATGVASVMAIAPGVTFAMAFPAVYACLYGPEAAKALKELGKLGGTGTP